MSDRNAIALRLARSLQIIDLIDRRREMECDMGIGASVERQILSRELAELEADWELDCGFRLPVPAVRALR